jgi:hypothetical protein
MIINKVEGLDFDEPTHRYTYYGEKLVGSISSISAIANGDSFGMASAWASKVVSQEMSLLVLDGMASSQEEVALLAEQARNKPNLIRDISADFGTKLHKYIEEVCNGNDPPLPEGDEKLRNACIELKLFAQEYLEPIATELRVVLQTNPPIAGTADLICSLKGGDSSECFVLDWKGVTKGSLKYPLKKSFFCQLEAYRHAVIQNHNLNCVGCIVVRIDRDTAEIKAEIHRPKDSSLIDIFMACREIFLMPKKFETELLNKGE